MKLCFRGQNVAGSGLNYSPSQVADLGTFHKFPGPHLQRLQQLHFWAPGTRKFLGTTKMAVIVDFVDLILNFAAIAPPHWAFPIRMLLPIDESPGWKLCICYSEV